MLFLMQTEYLILCAVTVPAHFWPGSFSLPSQNCIDQMFSQMKGQIDLEDS